MLPFSTGTRITTQTNLDSILSSPDVECFQIIILFLVSAQYISSSLRNRTEEHYLDSQVISQQKLRIRICCTLRATSHLCVKRERPLIITYSLYSENIIHYHFYLKHLKPGLHIVRRIRKAWFPLHVKCHDHDTKTKRL